MKKPRVLLHLAALAMGLCLLAGCAAQPAAPAQATIPHIETSPQPTVAPSPTPTPTQTPAQQQDLQQVYGSCGLLAWPSVLYSIYLQDDANPWTEEALAQTRQNLAVAVDWITQQAQTYNAQPKIYYDTGENNLSTFAAYKAGLTEDTTTGTTFYDDVDTLTAQVDVEFIQQQYGTASIGYLIFLPVEGASYSILHYLEDGGNYLNEFSCLYLYDSYAGEKTYNSPTVYAHEILHLFGAADLYVGSRDTFVTQPLAQYVLNTWPDAIMYYTYNSDNGISYEHIEKTLCPLTAYRLGLVDSFPGSEQFPAATQDPPGVFSNGTGQNWTASDEAT